MEVGNERWASAPLIFDHHIGNAAIGCWPERALAAASLTEGMEQRGEGERVERKGESLRGGDDDDLL